MPFNFGGKATLSVLFEVTILSEHKSLDLHLIIV